MKNQKLDNTSYQKSFFTERDYSNLKHKDLNRTEYKNFIRVCNRRIAKELVVENKEGIALPYNLTKLKIVKNLNLKGSKNSVTGETYLNLHTMGYVYKCYSSALFYCTKYKSKYLLDSSEIDTHRIDLSNLYKWSSHRTNIKRYLASILKKGILDYDLKTK